MKYLIIALLTSSLITSCSYSEKEEVQIELNNGEKWEMSPHMYDIMVASFELVDSYTHSEEGDHLRLAEELDLLSTELIESCDMTGEAHNKLHDWLMPYLNTVSKLSEATSDAEIQEKIEGLKSHKKLFFQTFK